MHKFLLNSIANYAFEYNCFSYFCLVTLSVSHLSFISMEGDCFIYEIRFDGVNFPPNGPVMQKKMVKWEPSTENMYARDGVLLGEVNRTLLLEDNKHHRCNFRSTYR